MASLDELSVALINADKSGDVAAARILAGEIQKIRSSSAEPEPSPWNPLAIARRAVGGAVEPLLSMGSGFVSQPIAGLAGIAEAIKEGSWERGADRTREVQNALTYEPKSEGGKAALSVISYPFQKYGELADVAGGKASEMTGSPALGAGVNTALQVLPYAAGAKVVPAIPRIGESAIVQAPKRFLGNIFNTETSTGRLLNDVAGAKRDAVIAALKQPQPTVGGEMPTAAQAAASAGSPEFSALQEIVANRAPEKFGSAGIKGAQEAARQLALSDIAGTPVAEQAAINLRKTTTTPMRESNLQFANLGKGIDAKPVIEKINSDLSIPGLRASSVVSKTLSSIRDKISELASETGTIDARDLYTIRKEIGNTITQYSKETSNWDKKLVSGLQNKLQSVFDDAIENAGGIGWRNYLSTYSELSKPINRMETGQALARALRNSLDTGERPNVFASAVAKAAEEPSYATGRPRMSDLTPQDQALISAIQNELARDATLRKYATEGASEATRRIGAILPEAPGVGVFAPKINVTRALYNRLIGRATESKLSDLAKIMDQPPEVARLMERGLPKRRTELANQLLRYGYAAPGTSMNRE